MGESRQSAAAESDDPLPTPRGGGVSDHGYTYSDQIERDAVKALELDKHNPKANYLLGVVFKRKKDYNAQVKYMQTAVEGAKRQQKSKSFIVEVETLLTKAKYNRWVEQSKQTLQDLDAMKSHVTRALAAFKIMQQDSIEAAVDTDLLDETERQQQLQQLEAQHAKTTAL